VVTPLGAPPPPAPDAALADKPAAAARKHKPGSPRPAPADKPQGDLLKGDFVDPFEGP
jgi:hypothetical protein